MYVRLLFNAKSLKKFKEANAQAFRFQPKSLELGTGIRDIV
jgi:hypothetical protein